MKIEFELISSKQVKIIGIEENERKEIGLIFTPSSSGMNIKNAIQVCGFKEAFDLWGCGRYKILNPLLTIDKGFKVFESAKDIQLLFDFEVGMGGLYNKECERCYNSKDICSCENEKGNPFNVKREKDLGVEYEAS